MAGDTTGLEFADLLNTGKALSVILGIFLSVAIAFFFGTVVQFVSRTIFSFNYKSNLKWKIGLFGRHMCHGHSLFPAYKGSQRAVVYDARSSSLDRRQHGSYNWWLSSLLLPC